MKRTILPLSALCLLAPLAHASAELRLFDVDPRSVPPEAHKAIDGVVKSCHYSEMSRIGPPPASFRDERTIVHYYRQGMEQFYLWWGNNVFDYDAHPLVHAGAAVSRSAEQLAAMIVGVHPRIRALPTPANATMLESLVRLRGRVMALTAACVTLLVLVLIEGWRWKGTTGQG